MFRGVKDALLALEHTVIAVLHQQAQHGGAQHPGHHLHLPLFGRQLLAGVESIFQQIAQHHAEVGLRDGQLAGQFQPPVHRHAEAVGLVVVVTGQSVHGRIRAEGGALLAQLGFVLVQVIFQLIHLPGLGESGDDVEVLAEVVAEMPRLLHIGPQLGVAAGLHGQQLVFPVQLGAAGVLPGHLIHLVQQQKDAQQRDGDGQDRNDHQTVDEHDGRVQRHAEDEESRVDGGQRPRRLPEGFAPVLPQQPAAPFDYNTFIVGCQISNRDIRSYTEHPIIDRSITYTDRITLNHNQSMFTLEFAALNYNNQNRVSYKYILEGYEKEWHYNGKNRIASYTNVPPGKYLFRVQTLDEANPGLESFRELTVVILPPWWASWWAYVIYMIIAVALLLVAIKLSLFMIKVKNDVYIEQKLSELKIKFFTNISHELRTPLTLIQGPIQELREKEKLSQKGMQYVDLMEKNTKQMLQLVNQILDFRKIQNGKMRLHVSLFNLNEMVDSFEKEFRVMAEENEVSFTFQLAGEDIMVWADKEKVAIVIRNIISNAFKFTPAGGNIYVTMGVSDDDRHCYVRVEDSGVGIPQSKLSEIFERFSQADNARGAYYQGTGIGLALSKEIISLHHGEIYAESPEGKGAVFTIELQLGKEHYKPSEVDFYMGGETVSVPEAESVSASAGKESEEEKEQPVDSSLPTVLIVEDNKDLCNMLKLQLEDKFNIYMANDGVEGLKKVHLYHPDMVVTDQMMPNMDGIEMLQRIRKDFQISHIPVIILTAKGNDEAKTKAISMGANAYIIKPFSKDYLVARIEQLLNERKLFRERVWQQPEEHKEEQDTYEQFLVKKDVQFIEKIHQVIEENLDNSDFNIDTIASTIGLSRSAFFKR